MKTLKELYEIVKAAGGSCPFEIEFDERKYSVLCIGKYTAFLSGEHDKEFLYSIYYDGFSFPENSTYFQPKEGTTANALKNIEFFQKFQIIAHNSERWENMGRPWGRLNEGAEFLFKGKKHVFKNSHGNDFVFADFHKQGMIGFSASDCELSEKTLFKLDDWLGQNEDDGDNPCKFCKGKKSLTWQEPTQSNGTVSFSIKRTMPCPYCQPERFE